MAVDLTLATIRDVSFILSNLRPGDHEEITCQIPEGARPADYAAQCVCFGQSWVARWNGVPAMAFGVSRMTAAGNVLSGWAFGTRRAPGCLREVVRFCRDIMMPEWVSEGVTRIEARSLGSHTVAHRWMAAIGADYEADVPAWGRSGERFKLYAWRDTIEMRSRLDSYCR